MYDKKDLHKIYKVPPGVSPVHISNEKREILAIPIYESNKNKKPYLILVGGEIIEKNAGFYILQRITEEKYKKGIEKKIRILFKGSFSIHFL